MTSAMPRLLWLTQGRSPKLPSQRLRVLEILPYLSGTFEQDHCPAPTTISQVWEMRRKIRAADVVVLQKELVARSVLWLIRRFSKRLVYDFDDAVHLRLLADGSCRESRKRNSRFSAICRAADLVIAGNPILERQARSTGQANTAVLPTAVVVPARENAVPAADRGAVLLGWIGTDVNLPYLEALEPVFLLLQSEGLDFALHIMAGKPPKFENFDRFSFFPWAPDAEEPFLSAIDVGLMPLADNAHTRGKCAYKALQYMGFGKPVVVSDVGVTAEWTAGAGFAVKNETQVADALRQLIASADLRARLGEAGSKRVAEEFSRPVIASRLRDLVLALT